jgi:hypothetical protein
MTNQGLAFGGYLKNFAYGGNMKYLFTLIFTLLFISNSARSQWTVSQTGFHQIYTSISAIDDNTVWTGGHEGIVARTINGGASWNLSVVGDSLSINTIYGINNNTAIVITEETSPASSMIWKTSNGGNSWVQAHQQSTSLKALKISPSGTGLCIGNPSGGRWSILKTTDFGTTWDTAGMYLAGTGNIVNNCMYSNGSEYWFGASGGRLFHTSNDGASWTIDTVGNTNIVNIWFNGQFGIVNNFSFTYRTTDGGNSWNTVTHPGNGYGRPTVGAGNKMWQVSAGSIFIYTSTDNGNSWTSNNSFIQTKSDISISRTGSTVWISTVSDNILHTSTGVNINTISSQVPDGFSLSQNYPNPFNPSTKIKFAIPGSYFVKLAVYDLLGREVSSLVNEQLQAGTYEYEFEASGLNSGVYFYKISTESFSEVKKMILLK